MRGGRCTRWSCRLRRPSGDQQRARCPARRSRANTRTPNSAQFFRSASTRADWIGDRLVHIDSGNVVIFRGHREIGRRTGRPAAQDRQGLRLVTSCTKCRSMYSRSGSPSADLTTWLCHTFSARVRPLIPPCQFARQLRYATRGAAVYGAKKGPPLWEGRPVGFNRATALRGRRARPHPGPCEQTLVAGVPGLNLD